jgi:hypothetical protein
MNFEPNNFRGDRMKTGSMPRGSQANAQGTLYPTPLLFLGSRIIRNTSANQPFSVSGYK